MKPRTWISALTITLLLAAGWPVRAAFSTFFHMDGLPGDSQVVGHGNDVAINSFGWNVVTNASGQPAFNFTLQKYLSVNSPTLAGNCANGIIAPTATLSCYKPSAGSTTTMFYSLTLTNVQVTSVTVTNDPTNSSVLDETVMLQFTGIQWTYVPQNTDGSFGTPVVTSYTSP